jgi:hypothetical protein
MVDADFGHDIDRMIGANLVTAYEYFRRHCLVSGPVITTKAICLQTITSIRID